MGSILFGQQTICEGSVHKYWVDLSENSGNGTLNSSYTWDVLEAGFKGSISPEHLSGNLVTVDWKTTTPGSYTLRVIESNNGCSSSQLITVKIERITSALEEAYFICPGGVPIKIDAGGSSSYTYTWTVPSGVPNPGNVSSFDTNAPGDYKVSIFNGYCTQVFTTSLSVAALPSITEIKEISDGVIEVTAFGGNMPLYFSLDGVHWQTSNIFSQLTAGKTYTVYVKSNLGCLGNSKNITIFYMPNVITPQSDGINDHLILKGIENFPNADLKIYNRFGENVFDNQKDKTMIWNGYYLGRPVPTGTYWYVLDLGNGAEKKTGYILVKNRN